MEFYMPYVIFILVASVLLLAFSFLDVYNFLPKMAYNWKYIFIITSVMILISAIVYVYKSYVEPRLNNNYDENKEFIIKGDSSEVDVYMFTVDWCPHCRKAMPVWKDLEKQYGEKDYKGYKINLVTIDCTNDEDPKVTDLLNKYNVEGFPTIKLIDGDNSIDYDAKLEPGSFKQFLDNVL